VNFNGTGTVAIRASFNVSSITDNGTGAYAVNFTTAMTDANYTVVNGGDFLANAIPSTANQAFVNTYAANFGSQDKNIVQVAIFR
jgi:hypothetical protein